MNRDLSSLSVVRIGRPIPRDQVPPLTERIKEAFEDAVDEVETVDYQPPPVDRIDAALLTQALDQEVGGHVLGITDLDLVDRSGREMFNFLFGGKDNRNHVAVVSTRRIGSPDPRRAAARLIKVCLHELGHNFGLVHHYSFEPADGGGYCPMTKGDFNRHGERSYVRAVIDSRGFRFCSACRAFLRMARPLPA